MNADRIFRLLADGQRLRTLMLLDERELCVCHVMAVLGVSQPLVSRNLSMLRDAGFLDTRRDGKLVYYSMKKGLDPAFADIMKLLRRMLREDPDVVADRKTLAECDEFQRRAGSCDMKTFLAYTKKRGGRKKQRPS